MAPRRMRVVVGNCIFGVLGLRLLESGGLDCLMVEERMDVLRLVNFNLERGEGGGFYKNFGKGDGEEVGGKSS